VDRQDQALPEQICQSNYIRRSILEMHYVCPSDRARQIPVGPLAKLNSWLTCQHRLETGLPGKMLRFLEADTDLEIRFLANGARDGKDKSLNATVCALTRTNEK